ncbi:hypothetical protein E4U09_003972 [Claviceps aff. purpurea]|uniref:Myb-like domain-containing protein n=1 Tax=Claviceps aff. purpurea TaxID=1967640 RepID=A0A9P7QFQ0_9HYPO|nr:hypothetical protein E4U09_003972 [Claviceps aff. purpurea]
MGPSPQPQAQPGAVVTRRNGSWSPSEDDLLKSRVLDKGARDWVEVSSFVGSRSAKQCRRKVTSFSTGLPRRVRNGHWTKIGRHLNGRSDNLVKNWYNGKKNRTKPRERASTSPAAQRPLAMPSSSVSGSYNSPE